MSADPRLQELLETDPVMGRVLNAVEASRNVEHAARRRANRQQSLLAESPPPLLIDTEPLRWRRRSMLKTGVCVVAGCDVSEGLEEHHIWPRWVAGPEIADVWLIIELCPPHHHLWHVAVDRTA